MPRIRRPLAFALALAAVAWPAVTHASITPSAQSVVDRYVAATGGAAALAADTSRHVRGRLNTLELRGTFESWSHAPDRFRTRTSLGTLRIVQGLDGDLGWQTDLESRHVTTLDGPELEHLKGEAYFDNEMWARPGQGGGAVTQGSSSFRDGEEWVSLDVKPPHGRACTLWFRESDSLLARVVIHGEHGDGSQSFDEYRRLGGRRRPTIQRAGDKDWRFTWDPHDAPDQEQETVDSVLVNPPVAATWYAPPASRLAAATWRRTPGVAKLPFRFGSQHVWLRASINGLPPADFILDTGASQTTIDADYAEEIGLTHEGRMSVQGMGGDDDATFGQVASLELLGGADGDGVTLKNFKVSMLGLADDEKPFLWRRMCGLIGYDVLSRFVVEIDYDRQIVTLRDPKHFTYTGKGQALDMKLTQGVPLVHVAVDSVCGGDFLVDVGNAFGVIVHGAAVRRCDLLDRVQGRKQLELYGGGVGAGFVSWVTRLDRIAIGPYVIPKPVVGLTLGTQGMVGSLDVAGNIGSTMLQRFICTFDYDHRKLYLEPGKHFADPERWSRCGTVFARLYDKVIAAGVLHGSAADKAGLQPRDEVTTIDGKPVMSYTPEEMDALFMNGAPGTSHTLAIVRDGAHKTLTLTLQDAL